MGNSSNRDHDLVIYIETEKNFYNSGSNIEGVVFVQAKKNFAFDALYLRVEGDQWCQWFEGSSKNRQRYTGSQNFYSVEHQLEKYPKTCLQTGNYAYPFSFQLSQNIPGSFQSQDHESKIEYKLAAYFMNFSEQNNRQIQYIPLLIREPFRQQMVSYQGSSTQEPKSCGCFSKGKVTLQAMFDKNVCYEGQPVHVDMIVDNTQGSSDIGKIVIELVQNVFVSSNGGSYRTYSNSIYQQSVKRVVPKGQQIKFSEEFKIPQSVVSQTAIGTLVANHYRIQVSTHLGSVSSDNPCIYSPLFLLKKQFDIKNTSRPQSLDNELKNYQTKKLQVFRAPQYWFKKNMNLSVMNFRLQGPQENVQH